MIEKLKAAASSHWVRDMRDIRVVAFMAVGIIMMLFSWSIVGVIQTNYELQKKIAELEQRNQVYELEKTNLKLKNEYYNTSQYLELTARKAFGRAAPGERVYIVPESVALKHTVPMPEEQKAEEKTEDIKPAYQRYFEAWADFFLHR